MMKLRIFRWCVLLMASGLVPTALRAADQVALEVLVQLYSTRENPSFTIRDAATIRQFVATFSALPLHPMQTKSPSNPAPPSYAGFVVRGLEGTASTGCTILGTLVDVLEPGPFGFSSGRTLRLDESGALERQLFAAARAAGVLPAENTPPKPGLHAATRVERSVTISLVDQGKYVAPTAIEPPVTVTAGTSVRLVATTAAAAANNLTWFKDGRPVPGTTRTLEIAAVSTADTGLYWAVMGPGGAMTEPMELLVTTREGQRLLNLSVLGRITADQPALSAGLTIESGLARSGTLLLVRAVGPTLATFGVSGPLRATQLRVMDTRGGEFMPVSEPLGLPTLAQATERTGAFDLPAGSRDTARLYHLPAGAYTAQVVSADGGTGGVLLEIFEVPLR
jgi:hypothetical protein